MSDEKMKKMRSVTKVTIMLLVLSLFLLVGGVTFAVYSKFLKGTTNNVIQAGSIAFSYDENTFQGNGVKIENASRISDAEGKSLNGTNEYFDFSVHALSTLSDISYHVIVLKQDQSTLDADYVKVYVTTKNGNLEVASPLVQSNSRVLTYSELPSAKDGNGKIVYSGTVPKSKKNYHQSFRLRLWLADDVKLKELLENKMFSVKVKVVANEIY